MASRGGALCVVLSLLLPAAAASPLSAQDTAVPDRLTLENAVALAERHNPELRRASYEVESAEQAALQSFGSLLPSLSGSLNFSGGQTRSLTGTDDFGLPTQAEQFREQTSSSARQSLSASVNVFNLGAIRSLSAARAETAERELAVDAEAVRIRAEVARAYFDAVQKERQIELEARLLATAEAQLAAVERLLRVAARQPSDLLGAEVDVAERRQRVQQARNEARKSRLRLQEAMGVSGGAAGFELADDFPAVFDPTALDAASLVARAQGTSPQVLRRMAAVETADRRASAAQAAWFPVIEATGGITRSQSVAGLDAFFELDPPNRNIGFSLQASMPLFNGLQRETDIAAANIQARSAREELRGEQLLVEREVRSALIDLENAYASLRLAERRVELSRRRLELGREEYRLDVIAFTALQQIIDQAAAAERALLEARLSFATALFDLEERVGARVRP